MQSPQWNSRERFNESLAERQSKRLCTSCYQPTNRSGGYNYPNILLKEAIQLFTIKPVIYRDGGFMNQPFAFCS